MNQSAEEIKAEADRIIEAECRSHALEPEPASEPEAEPIPSAEILRALHRNEDGDADLFIRLYRGRLVFDHAAGQWFTWAGHHWTPDTTEEALAGVAEVADLYVSEMKRQAWARAGAEKAGQTKAADAAKNRETILARRVRDLRAIRRKQDVSHLARAGADTLGISGEEWDADPMSLSVLNGVIDLRTGDFRNGTPSDYFKTFAPTPWEGINAPRATFEACLHSTFGGDADLVSFMGRLLGYSITGKTTEAVLPILWGAGRNGKTVFLQAVSDVLGPDLAGPIEAEMLLETRFTRQSGGPASDLLHLRGRRLAWLSETNENRRINSGRVKLLSGGDLITGRAPYAPRQTTFRPTHKIFLLTNHKPKADAQDAALWRRVLLIPFDMVFVMNPDPAKPNERLADLDLAEKLRAERPGILAWLVSGCLEWQRIGLNPPESVMAATREYRDTEDTLKIFRAERCNEGPTLQVRAGLLYQAYRTWTEGNGERPVTATKFGRYFGECFDSGKDMGGKFYMGIGLTA
ncbi:MAG: phage/plasmid primase, P4 family [Deltaproteobacteria bacterium]|nr:phage/plasmid primase, P4 family [Deltaproteobacteria bacterium]